MCYSPKGFISCFPCSTSYLPFSGKAKQKAKKKIFLSFKPHYSPDLLELLKQKIYLYKNKILGLKNHAYLLRIFFYFINLAI